MPDLIRHPRTQQSPYMDRDPCVYILASRRHGTLYVGVTSNLLQRLHQHRSGDARGFTSRYKVWRLVHFEQFIDMYSAISREKQLKNWKRDWKIQLIERENPFWDDLATGFGFEPLPSRLTSKADPGSTKTD